ncbi:MAG: amino acid adenylation domain-containing protein [bacterium]|nr:amino acid adenylation domain-containing protein [bacterium]
MTPGTDDFGLPLSFAQQRLWFLDRLVPDSTFYNIPFALRLTGPLHFPALEAALDEIVRRHEVLRIRFEEPARAKQGQAGEVPLASKAPGEGTGRGQGTVSEACPCHPEVVQIVQAPARRSLPLADLGGLPPAAREAEARRQARAEAERPFDLTTGPLMRAALLRLDTPEHFLLVTQHHIVSDGWSLGVFCRELAALYEAFSSGSPSPLEDLPIQYADFALWQRQWLRRGRPSGEVLAAELAWWKAELGLVADRDVPQLQLPTDRPRPAVQRFRGAVHEVRLPASLAQALGALGRERGATLAMTLLAGLFTLLYRMTGKPKILIGSPIANRNRSEIEGLIGFFVNSLTMVGDVTGNPPFRELVDRVREMALGAYAHQELPFEKLVEELDLERDLSRNPLFQVMFALQNAPMERPELVSCPRNTYTISPTLHAPGCVAVPQHSPTMPASPRLASGADASPSWHRYFWDRTQAGLTLEALESGFQSTRFDLALHCFETADALEGLCTYDRDLFDDTTIRRLNVHYRILLEGAVVAPETPVAELGWLADAEEHQLRLEWSGGRGPQSPGVVVPELVAAVAGSAPDAVAVVADDAVLSYGALDRRAAGVARRLAAMGVGPESVVGVCLPRSAEMVVALLGVLKTGAAYLPLDPAYPAQRLRWMAEDAGAVLVTHEDLAEVFAGTELPVVTPEAGPEDFPAQPVRAESPAYVIYTSGSTGRPKGVVVSHAALANLVTWHQEVFGVRAEDRATQLAGLSFDASVWEIWPYLTAGATLELVSVAAMTPAELRDRLLERRVTVSFLPTPLAAAVLAEPWPAAVALRYLLTGGDRLLASPPDLPFTVVNNYGPTESAVVTTSGAVAPGTRENGAPPAIGRPIHGVTVYLLDRFLRPVPAGVPGELCIGGAGLARGYLGRPALSAERVVPGPHGRIYRSGDLVRYLADGRIDFLGRLDQQVKIRGLRIELGEIEALLRDAPGVRECAVTVREPTAGERQLVAYVVPDPEAAGEPAEQLEQWRTYFDDHVYREPVLSAGDPAFNIAGWKSTYNSEMLGPEVMREWLDDRLERLRPLRPRRVLEIGCGTGMILFGFAPECEEYWGTDFSRTSLDYVKGVLAMPGREIPGVRLLERPADDFSGLEPRSFDAVVLNSVVQYFPSLDYLVEVLAGAMEVVRPGGALFVGDVRSLSLLETFHVSLALYHAPPPVTREELDQRVREWLDWETELVLAPDLFPALRQRLPRLSGVEVHLQRGHVHELARFRYDVVLHVEGPPAPAEEVRWLDWRREGLSPQRLRQLLESAAPAALGLVRVPNARLREERRALRWLAGDGEAAIKAGPSADEWDVDPAALRELAEELGYLVEISWSPPPAPMAEGDVDVLLSRPGTIAAPARLLPLVAGAGARPRRAWSSYATNPRHARLGLRMVPRLRRVLARSLPESMVPAGFIVIERLPLTPNGKIDRAALRTLDAGTAAGHYAAPRNPLEERLVAIWQEMLAAERIGIDDDFFELGGHSMLAIQVVARVRDAFRIDLPVRALFETPTVAGLARQIAAAAALLNGHNPP